MEADSDKWLAKRVYRVHGSPYPFRQEVHLTFTLLEEVPAYTFPTLMSSPCSNSCVPKQNPKPLMHTQIPNELSSLLNPAFKGQRKNGQFNFMGRPLMYITPKENLKRHVLSAALTMGFGRDGWTQEVDRDGQEIWVIQRCCGHAHAIFAHAQTY